LTPVTIGRAPQDVLCGHCKQKPGIETCAVCKLEVCAACGGDWRTCSTPVARELRLGMGRRLTELEPGGRLGVVSHVLSSAGRLVDLMRGRYVDTEAPVAQHAKIRADGTSIDHASVSVVPQGDGWLTAGGLELDERATPAVVEWTDESGLVTHNVAVVVVSDPLSPLLQDRAFAGRKRPGSSGLDASRRYLVTLMRDSTQLVISDSETGALRMRPVSSREVIQCVAYDPVEELLVTGLWGAVCPYYQLEETLERAPRIPLPGAEPGWVGLASRRLAAAYARGGQCFLLIGILDDRARADAIRRIPIPSAYLDEKHISISPDGRIVAFALRGHSHEVAVLSTEDGALRRYGGHSDDVRLVAITSAGDALVTADDDNRVIVRPRLADGSFATEQVEVELREHVSLADYRRELDGD
jgi:hypothetical protein